jgi:hypothetical protein
MFTSLLLLVNDPAESKLAWAAPCGILNLVLLLVTGFAADDHFNEGDVGSLWSVLGFFSALVTCGMFTRLVVTKQNMFSKSIRTSRAHTAKLLKRPRRARGRSRPTLYFDLLEALAPFAEGSQLHRAAWEVVQVLDGEGPHGEGGGAAANTGGGGGIVNGICTAARLTCETALQPSEEDTKDGGGHALPTFMDPVHIFHPPTLSLDPSPHDGDDDDDSGDGVNTAGQPSRKSKSLDSLVYLPTIVWVAIGLSSCLCIIVFSYVILQGRQVTSNVENVTSSSREAAVLLGNLARNFASADLTEASTTLDESAALLDQYSDVLSAAGQTEEAANAAQLSHQASDANVYLLDIANTLNETNILDVANKGEVVLNHVADLSDDFTRRFRPLSFASAFVALLSAGWATVRSVLSFRRVRIAVRKGSKTSGNITDLKDTAAFEVSKASKFVGIQAGSIISGFVFVYVVVFGVLFILTWGRTYIFLFQSGKAIFTVGAASAIQVLFFDRIVSNRWLSDGYWITRPVAWSWFNSFMTFASLLTGLLYSAQRFALLIAVAIRAAFLLDETIFPGFISTFDTGHSSFMAVIFMQHRHNHPILIQLPDFFRTRLAAQHRAGHSRSPTAILTQGLHATFKAGRESPVTAAAEPDAALLKRVRARTRWKMAYTLVNNPGLIACRFESLQGEKVRRAGSTK